MISFTVVTILCCAFLSGTIELILEQVYGGTWNKIPVTLGMGCITIALLLQAIRLFLLL